MMKLENTQNMISAAAVTTCAPEPSPEITAWRGGSPSAWACWMRLTRNTS